MFDFLHNLVPALGVGTISGFVGVVAASAVLSILRESAYALRAKRRAFYEMQRAMDELEFRGLARSVVKSDFAVSSAELDALKNQIEAHLKSMSDRDRSFVHQGLYQRNKIGAQRYIKEVIGERVLEAA